MFANFIGYFVLFINIDVQLSHKVKQLKDSIMEAVSSGQHKINRQQHNST